MNSVHLAEHYLKVSYELTKLFTVHVLLITFSRFYFKYCDKGGHRLLKYDRTV